MKPAELYDVLERRRLELNMSKADVGRAAFGRADDTSLQNIRRGAAPSSEKLEALAKALNLEFYLGLPRIEIPPEAAASEEFAKVPLFETQLSAGAGRVNSDNLPTSEIAFRKSWFAERSIFPKHCAAMVIVGDSMAPTLHDRDLALVDRDRTEIVDHKVFAFVDQDGQTRVKRLSRSIDMLILLSDNPKYPLETRIGEEANRVQILGRVVWSGHDLSE